jgi:tyrosinase
MKVTAILATGLTAAVSSSALSVSLPRDTGDGLTEPLEFTQLLELANSSVIRQLNKQEESLRKRGVTPSCAAKNLVFRRE